MFPFLFSNMISKSITKHGLSQNVYVLVYSENQDPGGVVYDVFQKYTKKYGSVDKWSSTTLNNFASEISNSIQSNNFVVVKTPTGIYFAKNGYVPEFVQNIILLL